MAGKNLCKCGRKAVIHRKYEGVSLCRNHFIRSFESKVKRNIRQGKMISRGDKIAIALSGGISSSALLFFMNNVFWERKDLGLFALSVDEGIPGYSKRNLEAARKLCKCLGVRQHVFSLKERLGKIKPEVSVCVQCSSAKSRLLNRKAKDLGATKLCFAINLDDEIQGILINYIKGDLEAIQKLSEPVSGHKDPVPVIRPFRESPEEEIKLYAKLNRLETGEDKCPHIDGAEIITRKFLNDLEAKSPGMKFSVLKTCERLLPCVRELVKNRTI